MGNIDNSVLLKVINKLNCQLVGRPLNMKLTKLQYDNYDLSGTGGSGVDATRQGNRDRELSGLDYSRYGHFMQVFGEGGRRGDISV